MLQQIINRLKYWLTSDANATELDEEMRLHLALRAEKLEASGLTPADARHEAHRRFGNQLNLQESSRAAWIAESLDNLTRDLRLALRALLRRPGFTATAVLTLAVGIGANTAVFTVLNSVLLKPLAYPEPEQLVAVINNAPGAKGLTSSSGGLLLSPSMYYTFREQNRTFQSIGIWSTGTTNVTGFAEPEQIRVVYAGDGALQALRVPPLLGRPFTAAEHTSGAPFTVMLTHAYWLRRFGADLTVIGRKLLLDARPREIIGIMPPGFRIANADADVIIPLRFNRAELRLPGFGMHGIGRLKPGVTISQANADIARLIPIWMHAWPSLPGVDPNVYKAWRLTPDMRPLKEEVVGGISEVLWIVMATIAVVMLIAAANVASLLLVRMESRQQELAARAALGASARRIVRELLIESTLLGIMGGLAGLAAAYAAVQYLIAAGPAMLPRLHEIAIDARAIWFTLAFSIAAGALAGLIPALKYTRSGIALSLRGTSRTTSAGRDRSRTRNALVIAQVALAVVLLISAGLMIRAFSALRNVDPGFTAPERIQTARISVLGPTDQILRTHKNILDNLQSILGVESAAFITEAPMAAANPNWDAVCPEGVGLRASEIPPVRTFKNISPGLFQAMGTRLIAGRDLTWTDIEQRRPFALLSENLARELYNTPQAALHHRLSSCVPNSRLFEVIGVVQDVRDNGPGKPAPATVYWPPIVEGLYGPNDRSVAEDVTLILRTHIAGGEGLLKSLNQAVWNVNKSIPVSAPRTMREIVDRAMAATSFALIMLAIAGAMALLLGIIGIYGVVSYAVSQRRREMGIRLALGERPARLQARFVRQSLLLAATGAALGLAASAALMRLLSSLLYGTSPLDPATYAAVPLILLTAAALASYLPARRAAAVNPVEALRADS